MKTNKIKDANFKLRLNEILKLSVTVKIYWGIEIVICMGWKIKWGNLRYKTIVLWRYMKIL